MHYAEFAEDEVGLHYSSQLESLLTFNRARLSSTPSKNMKLTSGKRLVRKLASLLKYVVGEVFACFGAD